MSNSCSASTRGRPAARVAVHWRLVAAVGLLVCFALGGLITHLANHGTRLKASSKPISVTLAASLLRENPGPYLEISLLSTVDSRTAAVHPPLALEMLPRIAEADSQAYEVHPPLDFEMVPPNVETDSPKETTRTTIAAGSPKQSKVAVSRTNSKKTRQLVRFRKASSKKYHRSFSKQCCWSSSNECLPMP